MDTVQQIVPISDLKLHHAKVLSMLEKGPVVLAQRSKPKAVLVSVDEWDERAEELKRLRRLVKTEQQLAAMKAGNAVELDPDVAKVLEGWAEARRAKADYKAGRGNLLSWEELERQAEARYGMGS